VDRAELSCHENQHTARAALAYLARSRAAAADAVLAAVLGVSRTEAVLNALDRLCGGYDKQADTARQDLAIAEGQLRDYDSRLGQPFAHEAYLAELTSARDRSKAALSGAGPEPGAQPLPSSSASTRPRLLRPGPRPATRIVSPAKSRGKHAR